MDEKMMIESPKIFRLENHEEPFAPRLVNFDHMPRQQRTLRVASCHELSAPLRRKILQLRQAILDRQQETGSFVCSGGTTPQSIAELLLCSHWLGLQEDPSWEPIFSACIDRLIDAQDSSGDRTEDTIDKDFLSSTLLIDFALERFGISTIDQAILPSRKYYLKTCGSANINHVARGYLALYGVLPFEKNSVIGLKHFSFGNIFRSELKSSTGLC